MTGASLRLFTARTGRARLVVAIAAATAAVFLTPSAALADPPALNRDPCEVALLRAATWPGAMDASSGTVRLVSDAYVTHLSSQPACEPRV